MASADDAAVKNRGCAGERIYRRSADRSKLQGLPSGEGASGKLPVTSVSENHTRRVSPSHPLPVHLEVDDTPRKGVTVGAGKLVGIEG